MYLNQASTSLYVQLICEMFAWYVLHENDGLI